MNMEMDEANVRLDPFSNLPDEVSFPLTSGLVSSEQSFE